MSKPGVMFYFEMRPCLKYFNNEEKGILFEAMLDYAAEGIVPDLDGALGIAWTFIQQKLDRDDERYRKVLVRNEYARYAKEMYRNGEDKLSFDAWKQMQDNAPEAGLSQ